MRKGVYFPLGGKWLIILLVICLLVLTLFYTGVIKKDCSRDKDCFNKALKSCDPAKYLSIRNNNAYSYSIKGRAGDKCVMVIRMEHMAAGTDMELIELLEGKNMVCRVPKNYLEVDELEQIEDLIHYCTGPLKEGMYELIIEKLYGLIIQNMGDVINEMKDTLLKIEV